MTKISFNVEPPSLAQAMCGSKCLNYECQMYREDGTGKCHLVFPVSVRMCNNGEVFTDDVQGEKIEIYEKKEPKQGRLCSYKGVSIN